MKFYGTPDQFYEREVDEDGYITIDDENVAWRLSTYGLAPVHNSEAENEETNLAFCCVLDEDLSYIQQHICDPDITAAAFGTETGDYDPLYVRYGYPSFRAGGQWFRVVARDSKGRFRKGSL